MSYNGTQLDLHYINIRHDATLDDFGAPSFAPIINAIQELLLGKVGELYLFGNAGSGKSHLVSALQHAHAKTGKTAMFVSLKSILSEDNDAQMLIGLEMFDLIILDDIHLLAHHRDWQESLFHLINRARQHNRQLVFTANKPVNELEFELMDLVTRLSQALSFGLPDGDNEADRRALIYSILQQKGLRFDEVIIDFLVAEGPRHVGDIVTILDAIAPYFRPPYLTGKRGRKLPTKLLETVKEAIRHQSFLFELSDIEFEGVLATPESSDNLHLPL